MIGIIGAMEEEVQALRHAMKIQEEKEIASMVFHRGILYGKEAVVVRSGIGKVNAAICTQILADHFDVDLVINTGIAGSLDAAIDIGDMVISTDAVQHDMDTSIFGDPIGQVPRMDTFAFPADAQLVEKAVRANQEANPDIHTFTGRIASGDQFISSQEVKERIVTLFGAKCAEMEGAAIAHGAYLNQIPCVIVRAISDKADNSASMDYPAFEKKEIASMVFHRGILYGKEAVVVRSGIGKVNAAICTQILADHFDVDLVINTGIAGSLDAAIDIGDMVISTDAVQHDMDTSIFGDPIGQVPRMDTFAFPADAQLVEKAVRANQEANPDIHTFTGRIASGDQFISSQEVKERIVTLFGAKCAEMEGAAIAHGAYLNQIPCVIVRAISDKADNSASMDYPAFEKKAIEHSIRLLEKLLPEL